MKMNESVSAIKRRSIWSAYLTIYLLQIKYFPFAHIYLFLFCRYLEAGLNCVVFVTNFKMDNESALQSLHIDNNNYLHLHRCT